MSVSGSSDPPLCAVWVTPGEEKSNIQAKNMVELMPSESNIYNIYYTSGLTDTLEDNTGAIETCLFFPLFLKTHFPILPFTCLTYSPSSKYLLVPPSFLCNHMGSDKVAASTSNTTESSNWTIIFIIQQLPMKGLKSHLVWAHLHPLHDSEKYKQPRQISLHLLQRNTLWHFQASSPYLHSWFSPSSATASTCRLPSICSAIPV